MAEIADQPAPVRTDGPAIWPLVIADMQDRHQVGIARYGTPLQANNGRDALVDAYQEALDLGVYLRQAIEERSTAAAGEHECVPTQDAYNRACVALWKHRGRADALAAAVTEVAGFAEQVGYSVPDASPVKTALLGLATRLRDALRVDEAVLRDQPHPASTTPAVTQRDDEPFDCAPECRCKAAKPRGDLPPPMRLCSDKAGPHEPHAFRPDPDRVRVAAECPGIPESGVHRG